MDRIEETISTGSLNTEEVLCFFFVSLSRQIPEWILKPKDTVLLALSRFNLSSKHYLPTDHFLPCCHGEISRLICSKATFVIACPAFSSQN